MSTSTPTTLFPLMTISALQSMMDKSSGDFEEDILTMHSMYRLPVSPSPTLHNLVKPNGLKETASARIQGFLRTLSDEVSEGTEILDCLRVIENPAYQVDLATQETRDRIDAIRIMVQEGNVVEAEKTVLTMIADWLADMTVYVRSEAMKFGIPLEPCTLLVMASNFTKLPADGIPKHDENGKFLKDMTNYVPPESALHTALHSGLLEEEPEEDEADAENEVGDLDEDEDSL